VDWGVNRKKAQGAAREGKSLPKMKKLSIIYLEYNQFRLKKRIFSESAEQVPRL
jgi:hypothetical protein